MPLDNLRRSYLSWLYLKCSLGTLYLNAFKILYVTYLSLHKSIDTARSKTVSSLLRFKIAELNWPNLHDKRFVNPKN